MIYRQFKDKKLSLLGFGTMRLPLLENGEVDEEQVFQMVKYAAEHGVNYYDTAYPYHNCKSEVIIGKALKQLPRESFYLATKYPGHQIASSYDPAGVFEEQLQKCGVDYFDFYLLHNIYENSLKTYTDPRWGIVDYFIEQREKGRIKHLGFSCHGMLDTMKTFLDLYGSEMEFCQIQLNYLDWTLQNGKEKYELLSERNIPVWVMEPVRGGKLAKIPADERLKGGSGASWAFRFLEELSNVTMILSGMSNMAQMEDNIKTLSAPAPLSDTERAALFEIAEGMKNSVPCTACGYCRADCPKKLDIPKLLSLYNDMKFFPSNNVGMAIDSLSEDERPGACVSCGKCARTCPQKIDVPAAFKDFTALLETVPHWADMCRRREEAARRLREQRNS